MIGDVVIEELGGGGDWISGGLRGLKIKKIFLGNLKQIWVK